MKKITILKLSENELMQRGVKSWPVWEKEISRFDWYYDETEECYIIEGEVFIKYENQMVNIRKGDFVIFEKGLTCHWDIKKPIQKYYNFPA